MRNASLKMGVITLALVLMGAGCATPGGGGGMSDEDAIRGMVAKFEAAIMAQDLDAMFALMADDFEMSDGLGKDEYREFIQQLVDAEQFDGVEISSADLEITVDGDSAEAMPVVISAAFGDVTIEFELEKRDGAWLVTYINQVVG